MVHPFHAEGRAKERAKAERHIRKTGHQGFARGGSVHPDAKEDAAMDKKAVHEHEDHLHKGEPKTELHLEGKEPKKNLAKRARGGKTPHKKGGTKVNVIVMPQKPETPQAPPPPHVAPPAPPRPPAPPAGAQAPHPAMPPGGGRPGMGMPMAGGAPGMMRARGGAVDEEAGAGSGEGRIDKMHEYGEGGFKPKKQSSV